MSIAIEQTIQALKIVLQTVPVGTNLALIHLLWSILNGSFLPSRGAIFPGLQFSAFAEDDSRRSWAAMRYGRAHPQDMSQDKLKETVLTWLGRNLADNEIAVFDAGAHISEMQSPTFHDTTPHYKALALAPTPSRDLDTATLPGNNFP